MPAWAVVSGASRRLGLHMCEQLHRDGWSVIALTREASPQLHALACDTFEIHSLESYSVDSIQAFLNHINDSRSLALLINNASQFVADKDLDFESNTTFESMQFIHMSMPAMLIQGMVDRKLFAPMANVISITDIYADTPQQDYALYCSTKAGLQNLSLAYAGKLAPNVRVNCIQPGPIKFLDTHSANHKAKVLAQTPLGFEGGFDPIYKTVKYILGNNYLTGACIKVDGGRSLLRI
jgi:dihydromonapterin reductase/dihydrofolate reductase